MVNYLNDSFDLDTLTRRYGKADVRALAAVICPLWVPIRSLEREIVRLPGQQHWRANFSVQITKESQEVIVRGCTGKFVPKSFVQGTGLWQELAKGRIVEVKESLGVSDGEIYVGDNSRSSLEAALDKLSSDDYLEIDRYGAAAKILSSLTESQFSSIARQEGFEVRRMPEDMARHLGAYLNYDFELKRNGKTKRVEVKSLWGTDTKYARLIHSTTTKPKGPESSWTLDQRINYYPTSSCKFSTQDIFAVSLFLRTGKITDFAFARSVPKDERSYGLPRARKKEHRDHVNQNPLCEIGDGTWFRTISEVWNLT